MTSPQARKGKRAMKKETVAVYCRLSVEDEGRGDAESESIQNQRSMLLAYAEEMGWEVYRVEHRANIVRKLLRVPLIDKAVNLTSLFVFPPCGIHMGKHTEPAFYAFGVCGGDGLGSISSIRGRGLFRPAGRPSRVSGNAARCEGYLFLINFSAK